MLHKQKKVFTNTKSSELLFASYLANMNVTNGTLKKRKSRENLKIDHTRIELLSNIKDLLYAAINRGYEVLGSKEIKENISNNKVQPLPSSLLENDKKPSLFLPPPNKKVDGNKLKVKTANGKIYQVDRWCPHDNADLNIKGVIIGSKLFCTKHNWSFDLEDGGTYSNEPEKSSINASPINVW
ncbi:231_t:CDS:2 [Diversispora eburnea]|uniref:231_t:CDS:1 n=1 Tax=Diversispora eburnea TaxID=1213867 RepID=A0A9N8WJN4_9GLOM|nr:231_t:CDS:2 [Diversispora eburnea]